MQPEPDFKLGRHRGRFCVVWYDEGGGRQRRSLGTADRGAADEALKSFVARFRQQNRPARPSVRYAWDLYARNLGAKPAAVTMGFERKAIEPFFGDMLADAVTEEDCHRYIALRRKLGRKDGTIWTELGHLRSALRHAEKKDLILKAPAIYRPERAPPRDLRLTRAQVKQFLGACELPHVRLFVILAMTTGARMGAILGLTWDRVDFETGMIDLHDPGRARTKKGRALVPMNKTSRAALQEAAAGRTGANVIEWAGQRVLNVKKAIQGAGQRAKLPWVTAHVFRHSAASHMAEAGVKMETIAQYLGHADSRITERVYARFSPDYLREPAASLEIDLVSEAPTRRRRG